jgi:formylglycine-generating enzyme required for sulfatase activity
VKGALVVVLSTALTTLAIHASDILKDPGTLIAAAGKGSKNVPCPLDMVYVENGERGYCIDRYEASAGPDCPNIEPKNQFETRANIADPKCGPVAKEGRAPWVNAPFPDALALCMKAGKRLPTNKEWYRASIGTPDRVDPDDRTLCSLGRVGETSADETGSHVSCKSSSGVYDMVGNVWEWVDGEVENGFYQGRELPKEGFVAEIDTSGVPTKTSSSSDPAFGDDYFFVDPSGVRGMIRGGFWSIKERGGIFDVNATVGTSFVGNAVGFRCAKDAT